MKTIELDDQNNPWWVAKDVCAVLGITNPSDAIKNFDSSDKASFNLGLPGSPPNFVSESGLYKLIMRSDKPQARVFQNWVTQEVLPSIRKTGTYIAPVQQQFQSPANVYEAIIQSVQQMAALDGRVSQIEPTQV